MKTWMTCLLLAVATACSSGGSGKDSESAGDTPGDAAADALADAPVSEAGDVGADGPGDAEPGPVLPLREMIGPEVTEKVRFVFDKGYEGQIDEEALKEMVLSHVLREAGQYTELTAAESWWDDYQDSAEVLYYSAEHEFSQQAPYPGRVFMPGVWDDLSYRVSDVSVEFADLSGFYAAVEQRKRVEKEPAGTEWTLLAANDGLKWAHDQFSYAANEMVVVVTKNDAYEATPHSYYFLEEDYGSARGFSGNFFNVTLDEWPTAMQEAEGLEGHDVPIWMHFAFLNGEWDEPTQQWRLFPSYRWGGYENDNIYFIEGVDQLALGTPTCSSDAPNPASHYFNDEIEFKKCLTFTQRIHYDWYRLWRHAFNVPSFPFWWSEKIDIRAVVVDLREYTDGKPEYEEDQVIDWQTVEDSVREANPMARIVLQRYLYTPPPEIRDVLLKNLVADAKYPLHVSVGSLDSKGKWHDQTMDWHYHFDISGLPGMQTWLAAALAEYFGGADAKGVPLQYDPFARPYVETGKPFVIPALFFLTPHAAYQGTLGGWTTNTGDLICILASQFGYTCEQIHQMMEQLFGQPVGPNIMAWSDAYCLWWEVFVVDWTYTPSPIKTLRWILDPEPFKGFLESIPEVGQLLAVAAPELFDMVFGRFHPWATGFPFWTKETLVDSYSTDLSRQFASYQFAESLQHNIGYKHQTTVIFESPYLGMEDGFDYIKHRDLKETFDMDAEQINMPFYSTEPGSRDFTLDANSYMTHKMGAGTRHMLGRIFARREILELYEALTEVDPACSVADPDYQAAVASYRKAAGLAVAWEHKAAHDEALSGLSALDTYLTANGNPDRLHTDWDADMTFTPAKTGMDITPEDLDKALAKIRGPAPKP
jgi:hypothetical protein